MKEPIFLFVLLLLGAAYIAHRGYYEPVFVQYEDVELEP